MSENSGGAMPFRAGEEAALLSRSFLRVLLGVVFVVGLLLRLDGLSYPPFDSHSFRQTQTLSTIEAFHGGGIDLLHPRAIYMGYPGTFVLELPVFQALAATLYNIFGAHLELIRLLNILFGAASMWLLFRITAHLLDRTTALLTAIIYWLAPLNILYQRSMLLDPSAVCLALLAFYSLAVLLVPKETHGPSDPLPGKRLHFGVFVVATMLTALIKALYLWPSVLLLAQVIVIRRFKFDAWIARVLTIFAIAGGCFLAWNYYAAVVNDASPITRGVKPTSLLGVSELLSPGFYLNQLVNRPKWWLSVAGALLYPVGLLAGWAERSERSRAAALLLVFLVPPTYVMTFATMNNAHDYYQLIITPFLAITAGTGLRWLLRRVLSARRQLVPRAIAACAGILMLFSALTYLVWLKQPRLDGLKLRFQELCLGKVTPWEPTMLFVARSANGTPPNSYIPEYLYAAKLWGYGRTVEQAIDAKPQFEELAPAFQRLEYVLFYGTECPDWLPREQFHLMIQDESHRLYVFQKVHPG